MFSNFDDLLSKVLEVLPNALIEQDDKSGELIVSTGLTLESDGSIKSIEPEEDYTPCDLCGVYPGDPHNGEAHLAEMRYEADPQDAIDAWNEQHMYDDPPLADPEDCEHGDASCRDGRWTCDLCETDMGPMCGVPVERFGLQECQHDESSFIHDKESTFFEHDFEPYVEQ